MNLILTNIEGKTIENNAKYLFLNKYSRLIIFNIHKFIEKNIKEIEEMKVTVGE